MTVVDVAEIVHVAVAAGAITKTEETETFCFVFSNKMNVDEFLRDHAAVAKTKPKSQKRSRDDEGEDEDHDEEMNGGGLKHARLHNNHDDNNALAGLTEEQRRLLAILDAGDEVCFGCAFIEWRRLLRCFLSKSISIYTSLPPS